MGNEMRRVIRAGIGGGAAGGGIGGILFGVVGSLLMGLEPFVFVVCGIYAGVVWNVGKVW